MRVHLESIFDCSADWLFDEVQKTESFFYVTKPLMKFIPENNDLADSWQEGKYRMKMYFLGIIPLGRQWIVVEKRKKQRVLRDNGKGQFISKWDHWIKIVNMSEKKSKYIDRIDIEAGLATIPVWLFAQVFYRYRQWRWGKWIAARNQYQ